MGTVENLVVNLEETREVLQLIRDPHSGVLVEGLDLVVDLVVLGLHLALIPYHVEIGAQLIITKPACEVRITPLINTLLDHVLSDVGLLIHPLTTNTIGLGSWT